MKHSSLFFSIFCAAILLFCASGCNCIRVYLDRDKPPPDIPIGHVTPPPDLPRYSPDEAVAMMTAKLIRTFTSPPTILLEHNDPRNLAGRVLFALAEENILARNGTPLLFCRSELVGDNWTFRLFLPENHPFFQETVVLKPYGSAHAGP